MFWRTYGTVIGWMLGVGTVAGGLLLLVVFGWLIPLDRGEESALVLMPFYGGFLGLITAVVASSTYGVCLGLWSRRPSRSIGSRAVIGALSAGVGALALWVLFGLAWSGADGLMVWVGIGAACALFAMLIAGPLTARAARRADNDRSRVPGSAVSSLEDSERARTIRVFPEWGRREVVGRSIRISPELRHRFREWNDTWQYVLDPVFETRWPDSEIGRQWIAEGESLVRDLQEEVGPAFRVVGDFAAYDPDA